MKDRKIMDENTVRERIISLADEDFRKFHGALVPGEEDLLGVRVPVLRSLAKDLMKEAGIGTLLEVTGTGLYEERMIRGMFICLQKKADTETLMRQVEDYLPLIDNWCICDTFCAGLKEARKDRERWYPFITSFLDDERTYFRRFALVMMLDHFIDEGYRRESLERACALRSSDYYVVMAQAWLISMCYVRDFEGTDRYVEEADLPLETYRLALRKTIESRRTDDRRKIYLREKIERKAASLK